MKPLLLAITGLFLLSLAPAQAEEAADLKTEMKALVTKIQTKIKEGKRTEQELATELQEFDTLIAKHGKESEAVAQVVLMKAMLYFEVLQDTAKGTEFLNQIKAKYPGTQAAAAVDQIIASLEKQKESRKIQDALVVGSVFPNFEEKDLNGKPLSISGLKGKVVLVDFWATWCGPCVAELPNVTAVYEKFHGKGFEIVGISLDKDQTALTDFLKSHDMAWPQFFDGKGWSNKLAQQYGIHSIPATYLLDKDGKILAKGLRGEALEPAVAKALGGG